MTRQEFPELQAEGFITDWLLTPYFDLYRTHVKLTA